ncbi:MAG TPA: PDZ domain-containing protein, partial [Planctomycetota bacterium]|nr:PDZ domain-containing protein [Planctomycetota bacterium]
GQAARAAGLRVGDVVVSFAGEDRFASHDHFQTWVRLRCKVGDEVEVVVWRDGKRVPLQLTLPR